ncbi:putative AAA family ATPase, partial [Eremomyces bilateralis CBS 781.70]
MVGCPICGHPVREKDINAHLDSDCADFIYDPSDDGPPKPAGTPVSTFFTPASAKPPRKSPPPTNGVPSTDTGPQGPPNGTKRKLDDAAAPSQPSPSETATKRSKLSNLDRVAPLADRMRPRTLSDVAGQDLVSPHGILPSLLEEGKVPSMILWGTPGTGKTTIARLVAAGVGGRCVEIHSTSSGVGECKRIFAEARGELAMTGRRTVLFCDEIHRFTKAQQDVFLGPVEAGQITLIGATTENPSFKVINALLSRCRVFTLSKLSETDILSILHRAMAQEDPDGTSAALLDEEMLTYIARFACGDARTGLNLLELALSLAKQPTVTRATLQQSLTKTVLYDRAGDSHYDTISALHKSIRGSDPDAALFYLARMLHAGDDPLFIARRLIVVASEDVGLADASMLPLATAAHAAVEKVGMPEARINLAHAVVALARAPKSTRVYRGLGAAMAMVEEVGSDGVGMEVPAHLRMGVSKLLKEMGVGVGYKYNPDYEDGRVKQEYLPEAIRGRTFLEDRDLGTKVDPDL